MYFWFTTKVAAATNYWLYHDDDNEEDDDGGVKSCWLYAALSGCSYPIFLFAVNSAAKPWNYFLFQLFFTFFLILQFYLFISAINSNQATRNLLISCLFVLITKQHPTFFHIYSFHFFFFPFFFVLAKQHPLII